MRNIIAEMQSDLWAIENDEAAYEETSYLDRVEAIDFIEFHIVDRIESMLQRGDQTDGLAALRQRAVMTRDRLEEANSGFVQRCRANIASGNSTCADLKRLFDEFNERSSKKRAPDDIGYDSLDMFVNDLLRVQTTPKETHAREPEMVFYQPTPTRVVLELIEQANITQHDVFYDLGSGLGKVPILVSLLSGAMAKGVEFEPAYCEYARQSARGLGLDRVEFINSDARQAHCSDGIVFFMYTPFEGKMLQEVLQRLQVVSRERVIRIGTYGPCTPQVSSQDWLKRVNRHSNDVYKLAIFTSTQPGQGSP